MPVIPGFEIIAKLSSGGMGDVLLAHRRGSHGFEKLFAIKTIRGDKLERHDIRAMFLDEARLLARLDHPSIAQVYDFGEVDEVLYLAMEYVAGVTFGALIKDSGIRVSPIVAARLIAEVCWGLHNAHELRGLDGEPLGVVHRDVSPVNLLVTYTGGVKIIDFGIALMKERQAPITQVGQLKGKPAYMAPEQRQGGRPDRRTDIYAVSIVLYELLARRRLFYMDLRSGRSFSEIAANIAPPSSIAGPLPPGLDEIVLKGLALRPEDRFQDARALKIALEGVIASVGGETLHDFAENELRSRRDEHDQILKALLSGDPLERELFEERAESLSRHTISAVSMLESPEDLVEDTVASLSEPGSISEPSGPSDTAPRGLSMPAGTEPPSKPAPLYFVRSDLMNRVPTRAISDFTDPPLETSNRGGPLLVIALVVGLVAGAFGVISLVARSTPPAPRDEPAPALVAATTSTVVHRKIEAVEPPKHDSMPREPAPRGSTPRESTPRESTPPPATTAPKSIAAKKKPHRSAAPANPAPQPKHANDKGLVVDW
jgi:serine/threonine protein kinase